MSCEITCAMPVYNASAFIERALLSALNQSFKDVEFLIIDDKGTDNSMAIVQSVITSHPRGNDVRIIDHVYNRGIGATRNTALDQARGKYIFFMDNDDELTPDCLEILYCKMVTYPVDFVAASFVRRDLSGQIYSGCSFKEIVLNTSTMI